MCADQIGTTLSTLTNDVAPHATRSTSDDIASIGRSIVVKGEVLSAEHLIIEGRVEGQVSVADHGVSIAQHATVLADVLARTITVRGVAKGNLTATERVEILASSRVEGRLVAPTVVIDEGAHFRGSVDPKKTDAAIAVGRHRLKQRAAQSAT